MKSKHKTLIIDRIAYMLLMISIFTLMILSKYINITNIETIIGMLLIAIPFNLFLWRKEIRKMKKSPILFIIATIGLIGVFLASPNWNIINVNFAFIFTPMLCVYLLAFVEWYLEHFDESIFKILLEKKK